MEKMYYTDSYAHPLLMLVLSKGIDSLICKAVETTLLKIDPDCGLQN